MREKEEIVETTQTTRDRKREEDRENKWARHKGGRKACRKQIQSTVCVVITIDLVYGGKYNGRKTKR